MEVGDCVEAILHCIEKFDESINLVNLGSVDTASVTNIAEVVIEETGFTDAKISYTGGDRGWAGDIPRAMLAIDKLRASGFEPTYTSVESIRHTAKILIEEIGL